MSTKQLVHSLTKIGVPSTTPSSLQNFSLHRPSTFICFTKQNLWCSRRSSTISSRPTTSCTSKRNKESKLFNTTYCQPMESHFPRPALRKTVPWRLQLCTSTFVRFSPNEAKWRNKRVSQEVALQRMRTYGHIAFLCHDGYILDWWCWSEVLHSIHCLSRGLWIESISSFQVIGLGWSGPESLKRLDLRQDAKHQLLLCFQSIHVCRPRLFQGDELDR